MKIFLSHCSRDKANVRDFSALLPACLKTWLDEDELLWSEQLKFSLQKAIKTHVDYVIIFIGPDIANSHWVMNELEWALQRERELGRNFVLAVRLPGVPLDSMPEALRERLHLELHKWDTANLKTLATLAVEHLLGLLANEHAKFPSPPAASGGRLSDSANRLCDAAGAYPEHTLQRDFVRQHVESLTDLLLMSSKRLRSGEVVTDYDDCSLLTSFIQRMGNGDELLGLTDWKVDEEWWGAEDAQSFLKANRDAIANGALIRRIFVYQPPGTCEDSSRAMAREMDKHRRLGIKVFFAESLPKRIFGLESQCVLSSATAAPRNWLTYKVQRDHRGYPLRNVFSLRDPEIEENLRMLRAILDHPGTHEVTESDPCGPVCETREEQAVPSPSDLLAGRRLYIHKDSFEKLAARTPETANSIYSALAAVPVVKLAFHDLHDAADLGEIPRSLADRLTTDIARRWYSDASRVLRQIVYQPAGKASPPASPLLQPTECICATCFDSDYYTFATSDDAARRMYADVLDITQVRRRLRDGDKEYADLCLISGDTLRLLPPTLGVSGSDGPQPPSGTEPSLTVAKLVVIENFECWLRETLDSLRTASSSERAIVQRFANRAGMALRRVLSVPVNDEEPAILPGTRSISDGSPE